MKMKWKKIAVIAMIVATLGASISALAEEIESRKLAIIQVEGTEAQIARPNGSKFKAIKGMSLGQGNKVYTGKNSYVYITADDDKTFKMDDNTIIAINKATAKSLKVELQDGELFFNVEKPLAADEELSFRVANTSMSIRGTSGWLRYGTMDMEFFLVEGKVSWMVDDQEILINAGERVVLERDWGGKSPAPGMPLIYKFKEKVPFTWTDLSDDALITIMENRAKLDLTVIGLDTPEKIAEAAAKVEAIIEARKPAPEPEPVYEEERENSRKEETNSETSVVKMPGVTGDYFYNAQGEPVFIYYGDDSYGSFDGDEWYWDYDALEENGYRESATEAGSEKATETESETETTTETTTETEAEPEPEPESEPTEPTA